MPNAPLDFAQVMEQVRLLKQSAAMQGYRKVRRAYLDTIGMAGETPLPDDLAKGKLLESKSPRGMLVKRQIKAEVAGYPTYTTVTAWNPDGKLNAELKDKADNVERWLTLKNEQLLPRVKSATYDYELATSYAVWLLHCEDPLAVGEEDGESAVSVEENDDPWSLEVVNPDTAYFVEKIGGTFCPDMLAREYTMLVKDAEAKYPDADWNRLSPGRPVDGANEQSQGFPGAADKPAECTFTALYSKTFTYHVLTRASGGPYRDTRGQFSSSVGMIVHVEPNRTGMVPAVIIPGDLNESGGDGKKMVPIMLALMQVLANRNLLNALRLNLAISQALPNVIVEATPQQFEAMQASGMARPIMSEEQLASATPQMLQKVVWVNGKPTVFAPAPNPDLDKFDERWALEEQFCVDVLTQNADQSTVAASTANAFTLFQAGKNRQLTPMLQHFDEALRLIDMMILHSIIEYDLKDGHPLYATKDMRRDQAGKIARGDGCTLTAQDLQDFNYEVYIATKQETEEQRQARGEQVWLLYVQHRISWRQVLESDVTDVVEQLWELNEGAGLEVASNTLAPYLPTMLNLSMQTRVGVNLGLTVANIAGAGGGVPAGGGGSAMPSWQAPTPPAAGGSAAAGAAPMGSPVGPAGGF